VGSNPFVLSNRAAKIFAANVDEWMEENSIKKLHYQRDPEFGGVKVLLF
jgi:hypothetical protein